MNPSSQCSPDFAVRADPVRFKDVPQNSELLSNWLDAAGYDVQIAADLAGAFAAVQAKPPDAVLLDVELGSEDGLELAEWMRWQESLRQIPVIAVTGHAMVNDQERMMNAGCRVCVSKPVDFRLLKETLSHCLKPRAGSGGSGKQECWW